MQEQKELQVIVDQRPGVINWNFEELKVALDEKLKNYETMVYTEDSVKEAKSDLAGLRKLRKEVEDKRKEIREKCLAPYAPIEQQAKELVGIIDKPIKKISEQTEEYERQRRAAVKEEIEGHMKETFSVLPGQIAGKLMIKVYDSRWENVTCSKKTWKDALAAALQRTQDDLKAIEDIEEDLRGAAMTAYESSLTLSDAIAKANELRRQKEIILENERRRREAEERRKAEEEARRAEEEARQAAENARQTEARQAEEQARREARDVASGPAWTPFGDEARIQAPEMPVQAAEPNQPIASTLAQDVPAEAVESGLAEGAQMYILRVNATEKQFRRICAFIEYIGASYEGV